MKATPLVGGKWHRVSEEKVEKIAGGNWGREMIGGHCLRKSGSIMHHPWRVELKDNYYSS